MVWALLAASEAITASKQPRRSNLASDLKSVTPMAASEAITASKQPQRSNMTSDLNSGTQITYFSMSTLLTCVAIAAGNKPFRHLVGYHNNRHQRNYVKKPGKTSPTTRTIPSEVCAAKHGWI